MARVDVVTEGAIQRPIGEVTAFAGDPVNAASARGEAGGV